MSIILVGEQEVGLPYNCRMTLSARIRELRKRKGLRQDDIAKHFGIARVSVTQWEGGITRPDPAKLAELATLLGTSLDNLLLTDPQAKAEMAEMRRKGEFSPFSPAVRPAEPPSKMEFAPVPESYDASPLEIRGLAVCGDDGRFEFNGEIAGYAERPESLRKVTNAYAIYSDGESMYPRFKPREVLKVNPNLPPAPGDDVVVQLRPREPGGPIECYIKEYRGRSGSVYNLWQWNPPGPFPIDVALVLAVHVIVPPR